MVTKLILGGPLSVHGYILAKNHMVTKRRERKLTKSASYILAKNHMVTKPQIS